MLALTGGLISLGTLVKPPKRVRPMRVVPVVVPKRRSPETRDRLSSLHKYVGEKIKFEFGWQGPTAKARIVAATGRAAIIFLVGPSRWTPHIGAEDYS